MKIHLELEVTDVREMIQEHFAKAGFVVKNMDAICDQFLEAYPQGLKVDAEIAERAAQEETTVQPSERHYFADDWENPGNSNNDDGEVFAVEPSAALKLEELTTLTPPDNGRIEVSLIKKANMAPVEPLGSLDAIIRSSRALEESKRS